MTFIQSGWNHFYISFVNLRIVQYVWKVLIWRNQSSCLFTDGELVIWYLECLPDYIPLLLFASVCEQPWTSAPYFAGNILHIKIKPKSKYTYSVVKPDVWIFYGLDHTLWLGSNYIMLKSQISKHKQYWKIEILLTCRCCFVVNSDPKIEY